MAKLVIDEEVTNAWGRLTSDSSETSWIAAGYPEGNSLQISLKGEGTGGLPEFIANLPADDIVWGAVKVVAVDNRGNLVSRRPKFVSVKYCPATGIAPMKRAKAGGHKGAVKQIMSSHVDIEIESAADLSEEAIIAKLRACGGAHQPTGYEFHSYSGGNIPSPIKSPVPPAAAAAAPAPAAPVAVKEVEKAPETVFVAPAEVEAPAAETAEETAVEPEVQAEAEVEKEEEEAPAAEETEEQVAELAEATAEVTVSDE